jgi:hypothetical protein
VNSHAPVTSELALHAFLSEPLLAFHPQRIEDRDFHPLRGLVQFGPFSRALVARVPDPIRIATIAPRGERGPLDGLLAELEARAVPRERLDYLPEFPGFTRVFRTGVVLAGAGAHVELAPELDRAIRGGSQPHRDLAEAITQAIGVVEARRTDFDVLFVYLPARWQPAFEGPPGDRFDLHDYLKAVTAVRGIPLQVIREDGALSYPCRASVLWHQGIAVYAKAGGVPWTLAEAQSDVAYIGLSYALRVEAGRDARFYTCCSQVFDADGTGLEFILYETDDVVVERENPYLSRKEMRHVMSRSLALYQHRHAGRVPRRVVVHKSTHFTENEVEGVFDGLLKVEEIQLVQVKEHGPWRGIQIGEPRVGGRGAATAFPVQRGSYAQLGPRAVLLWTQGSVPSIAGASRSFYKEMRGVPWPLELIRFAGHGGWEEPCRGVLGLTKMNWNNDALYDTLPVTMGYAQILARVVSRMPELGPSPYQLRFFM